VIHRSTQLCACCNVIACCQRYGGECLLPSKQVPSTALLHISKHKRLFCKQLVSSGRCGPESANAMRMQASNSVLLKICAGVCLFIDTPPNQRNSKHEKLFCKLLVSSGSYDPVRANAMCI